MLVSKKYSDDRLYRGVRVYDGLPLSSDDLHEYADTLQRKNAFLLNNIVGAGALNEPACQISAAGISLESPSVILVDGDIALIQADSAPLVPIDLIRQANYSEGLLCAIGWYQHLTHSSTLRAYGGVNNSVIENNLVDEELAIQLSTRYQLRWDIVLIDAAAYASGSSISINLLSRDAAGNSLSEYIPITIPASDQTVRSVAKPSSMDYAVSDLYIVPILSYQYSESSISDAKAYRPTRGTGGFSNSETEPTGERVEGDIWYDPQNRVFKFYINGLGYVPIATDPRLARYTNQYVFDRSTTSNSNIPLDIGISLQNSSYTLDVYYEGLLLSPNTDYVVDAVNNQVTLLNFTTRVNDTVTFVVTGLVESTS